MSILAIMFLAAAVGLAIGSMFCVMVMGAERIARAARASQIAQLTRDLPTVWPTVDRTWTPDQVEEFRARWSEIVKTGKATVRPAELPTDHTDGSKT